MSRFKSAKAYSKLEEHHYNIKNMQMRDFFEYDDERFEKYSIEFGNILFDYSKNRINFDTMSLLVELAENMKLKYNIEQMFGGAEINNTEHRSVLHTALRNKSGNPVLVNGTDVMPEIEDVNAKCVNSVRKVHTAQHSGYTGKTISDIVNIGIGGSDLGPAMVCNALQKYAVPGMKAHFVSNVDATDIAETLSKLNPETTLFVIASKTFTTQETITNANTAKKWFLAQDGVSATDVSKHFIALSTNTVACNEFGIDSDNIFEFWDWVGGRYSMWSAIGLSIALYIGWDGFERFLEGAYEADEHFRFTEFSQNIPVIMALLGIWNQNFLGAKANAVIPYDEYLKLLPAYLQQLDMESNGKFIDKDSNKIDHESGAVVFGTPGTNSQHSFFQLIHQGTQLIPIDFIAAAESLNPNGEHQNILLANMFAQSEALMRGKNIKEVKEELLNEGKSESEIDKLAPHKVFTGNKPSNTILMKKLNPKNLGSIIAFYEHKVYVQGVIWNINSFDQWGVELGKQLAKKILVELQSDEAIHSHDCSTMGLINWVKKD